MPLGPQGPPMTPQGVIGPLEGPPGGPIGGTGPMNPIDPIIEARGRNLAGSIPPKMEALRASHFFFYLE